MTRTVHEMRLSERSPRKWRATCSKVESPGWELTSEYYLVSPEDGKVDFTLIADNLRDGGGYSRFMVFDTR